tara:strand:+ start:231 stop:872 length:642 start_codon:yes stop_codon:yes gene_type:complete
MEKYKYDLDKYDFVYIIENLYDVSDLDLIHKQWKNAVNYEVLDDVRTDQKTLYHKHFYQNVDKTDWYKVYKLFIKEVIEPLFDEPILYQRIPTFRVHQPNNLAVAEYHRDSDYSHSTHEVNFFLPLTDAYGNNTIWAETERDKKDFQPMAAEVGEFWKWSGANLLHGNKLNDTGVSRVSVDFRVLPVSKYEENDKVSITNNTKMIIGDYWEKC